ncbi:putative WRKY transcription factor 50 [Dichanthelium oligosanthes]|uniref:Putative WRKY transcription factor 50 n=1 Tax=Dichanthelium oligosanthes TaxID=888268 RepID=A0A1E5VP70_9POAL|nr:putative WRKY transcription factor 50 [Dichanthelium oligosanthes]
MAASLGLNPEALFTSSYLSSYSSPFMSDYATSFPAAANAIDAAAFSAELDDLRQFDFSPAPLSAGAGPGSGDDRNDKSMWCGGGDEKRPRSNGRIGFRTRSEVEILDDGFKWRKYGKKAVKNSPNPRNYYRCSSEGCGVKKRVERDRDDPRYVITTYDGIHNHVSPGAAAIIQYGGGGFYSPPHSGSPSAASYSGSYLL